MTGRKYLVVGIGGATNSGKSSVSSKLCKLLPHAEWMRQDDYFLAPDDPNVETLNGYQNWDTLSALEMDRMVSDVEEWILRQQNNVEPAVLIVEGFLILNHRKLAALLEKQFFFTITKEVCEERRKHRTYNPPDTPGYFDNIVWPSYLKHLDDLKSQADIEYIDGCADLATITQVVFEKIEAVLHR
ncbi:unnamed protein product [Candidula unifasciata]|uniref:Nicotinamide riboside kinase 2 n=1 Tax=Candidula unifasciata TaxID=100452 RepID=A0A8S3YT64_9EUPU|nr:unnamed protein product [Candidula unifasciata]